MTEPAFPPLFSGINAAGRDPFGMACAQAARGCDAGLVAYDMGTDRLRAAMVLSPEVALRDALTMLPVCGVGFQNALGALAPPEVAVHLEWSGGIRINGGFCGRLRATASTLDPAVEPDWLVIGLELLLWPTQVEGGKTPDQTALYAEGCAEVDAKTLLEAWVRHTLVGINQWADDGAAAVHRDWIGLAHGLNQTINALGQSGLFLGVDEGFGMLLQADGKTSLIPLTELLESTP